MKLIIDGNLKNLTGENIRRARVRAHLTQGDLALMLEKVAVYICRGSLSRIEKGQRIVTDIELFGLSKVLNLPIVRFFDPVD